MESSFAKFSLSLYPIDGGSHQDLLSALLWITGAENIITSARLALDPVPKSLDPMDVFFLVAEQNGMVDLVVLEPGHIQRVVAAPAVGIDNVVGSHFFIYNWCQRRRRCIGNDFRVNLTASLQKTKGSNFSLGATSARSSSYVQDSCKDVYDDGCFKTAI